MDPLNWDDDIPNVWENKKCSSHHQPATVPSMAMMRFSKLPRTIKMIFLRIFRNRKQDEKWHKTKTRVLFWLKTCWGLTSRNVAQV